LQFLDKDDYKRYLSALEERKEYLVTDSDYMSVFHEQHLGQNKSDKTKEAECVHFVTIEEANNTLCVRYKQRVLCYLLSHIDAIASPDAQLVLLRAIKNVSDPVKAQLLHPTIRKLVQPTTRKETLNDIYGVHLKEFTALVLSSFDQSIANDLNETRDDLWPTFLLCIDHCFKSGMLIVL
jgi:U3 small nucleolar RNA-associated protein 10